MQAQEGRRGRAGVLRRRSGRAGPHSRSRRARYSAARRHSRAGRRTGCRGSARPALKPVYLSPGRAAAAEPAVARAVHARGWGSRPGFDRRSGAGAWAPPCVLPISITLPSFGTLGNKRLGVPDAAGSPWAELESIRPNRTSLLADRMRSVRASTLPGGWITRRSDGLVSAHR